MMVVMMVMRHISASGKIQNDLQDALYVCHQMMMMTWGCTVCLSSDDDDDIGMHCMSVIR